jgi:hypothetical protein
MSGRDEFDIWSTTAARTRNELLMGLHTARRLLLMQIYEANRGGTSARFLERDLDDNLAATRNVLGSVEGRD